MRPVALLAALAAALLAAESDEAKRWWEHVKYLADDALEGRYTGTPGHRKAAEYVAAQFEKMGAKPAGTDGYFQPVKFRTRKIVEEKSSLELIVDGKAEKLTLGEHALIGLGGDPQPNFQAKAVFAGYGLQIPEYGIDDLAGLDLKGKIVVTFAGIPPSLPATVAAHYTTRSEKWPPMRRAGAAGNLTVTNPHLMEMPWARFSLFRLSPGMSLADSEVAGVGGLRSAIVFNGAYADKLFVGTSHTASELFALDVAKKPMPRFPLKVSIRSAPEFVTGEASSDNVASIIPGSDPVLKSEYIVFSAHLDHEGIGETAKGDRIYNGAMDNAAGIATMLELGRMASMAKLKRSMMLLAVTAEEHGLLGSRYYSRKPTIPIEKIVANINLDMFLPIIPLKAVLALGIDESTLGGDFRAVAKDSGLAVEPDREPHRVRFIRSDQYNFVLRGVPALSFKIAAPPGTPEQVVLQTWIRERYHGPADDLNQPVDLEAAAGFNRLMFALVERVANREPRPEWKQESFFKRFRKPD